MVNNKPSSKLIINGQSLEVKGRRVLSGFDFMQLFTTEIAQLLSLVIQK